MVCRVVILPAYDLFFVFFGTKSAMLSSQLYIFCGLLHCGGGVVLCLFN